MFSLGNYESLTKMVAKLKDKIQECKRASFETNERLNKIWIKGSIKRRKNGHNDSGDGM